MAHAWASEDPKTCKKKYERTNHKWIFRRLYLSCSNTKTGNIKIEKNAFSSITEF